MPKSRELHYLCFILFNTVKGLGSIGRSVRKIWFSSKKRGKFSSKNAENLSKLIEQTPHTIHRRVAVTFRNCGLNRVGLIVILAIVLWLINFMTHKLWVIKLIKIRKCINCTFSTSSCISGSRASNTACRAYCTGKGVDQLLCIKMLQCLSEKWRYKHQIFKKMFEKIFGKFLENFWKIFGKFLGNFWKISRKFLENF